MLVYEIKMQLFFVLMFLHVIEYSLALPLFISEVQRLRFYFKFDIFEPRGFCFHLILKSKSCFSFSLNDLFSALGHILLNKLHRSLMKTTTGSTLLTVC